MALIDDLPPFYIMKYTDESGEMTTDAIHFNDQVFQTLQTLVADYNVNFCDGLRIPNKTTVEINDLAADSSVPLGSIWYDTGTDKLRFKVPGGITEEITST